MQTLQKTTTFVHYLFEPRIDIILRPLLVVLSWSIIALLSFILIFCMKIYVSNLDFSVRNEDLHEAFAAYGNVTSANIINDRETGRSRGFGFVEMENTAEAEAAISNLNDTSINGRNIRVAEAQEKPARSSNGGGGFNRNNSFSRGNKW